MSTCVLLKPVFRVKSFFHVQSPSDHAEAEPADVNIPAPVINSTANGAIAARLARVLIAII
ncbi:hypothetical protein ACFV2U_50985 [Streptomyces sp. NPDC059697]|uniref:hypothetical protein n=1 Tax=Streptomyces sp. NPDC059697 TaxID=3346912 RepID=UPI0036A399B9